MIRRSSPQALRSTLLLRPYGLVAHGPLLLTLTDFTNLSSQQLGNGTEVFQSSFVEGLSETHQERNQADFLGLSFNPHFIEGLSETLIYGASLGR